jgi:Arc/MetJ-type ribon-helix-helix transcriptional regulator
MTDHATLPALAEQPISVRLDERAQRALEELMSSGTTQSEAVRAALVEAAARRRSARLVEDAERAVSDPDDRRESEDVLAFMETLSAPWPDDSEG